MLNRDHGALSVAVKRLDPSDDEEEDDGDSDSEDDLSTEFKNHALMRHNNVVQVIGHLYRTMPGHDKK